MGEKAFSFVDMQINSFLSFFPLYISIFPPVVHVGSRQATKAESRKSVSN